MLHRTLERQIKRVTGKDGKLDMDALLELVSMSYNNHDKIRAFEAHTMTTLSNELTEANLQLRQQLDEAIAESQKRFEIATDVTDDGVWDWDMTAQSVWLSNRCRSMFNVYKEDVSNIYQFWQSRLHPEDVERAKQFMLACLDGRKPAPATMRFRADANTEYSSLLTRAMPIRNSDGQIARIIGVHSDVTATLAAQEALDAALKRAETANVAKSSFLATVTHELRTPLNSIITLNRHLSYAKSDEERNELMDVINASCETLRGLINDVLDFSKIEAGELHFENVAFNLHEAATRALSPIRHMASMKKLHFDIVFDGNPNLPLVVGDPLRLAQVITNLAGNAIKYTENGGVTVWMRHDEGEKGVNITLHVTDTGIGIPADKVEHIFGRFTQADASTTRKFGGTGLGLAITKSIVEMMGGDISVQSTYGEGSCFTVKVSFPYATDELVAELETLGGSKTSARIFGIGTPHKKARVMVVDDHPMNQIVASKVLRHFGIEDITSAPSGLAAIEEFMNNDFDVILMDCFMPGMDGYEATTKIREIEAERGTHTPVIAMTANTRDEDKEKCFACGMDHFTLKPINEQELQNLLSAYIDFSDAETAGQSPESIGDAVPEAAAADAVIDLDTLYTYTKGNKEAEQELIETFIEQSQQDLEKMRAAATAGDHKSWMISAHSLKGISSYVGAEALRHLASDAQHMPESTQEEYQKPYNDITIKLRLVIEALNTHLQNNVIQAKA